VVSYATFAYDMRQALDTLSKAIIARHKQVFPAGQDVRYTVTARNGKVKVKMEPPEIHEAGWRDE
jgi:hypothetical protein